MMIWRIQTLIWCSRCVLSQQQYWKDQTFFKWRLFKMMWHKKPSTCWLNSHACPAQHNHKLKTCKWFSHRASWDNQAVFGAQHTQELKPLCLLCLWLLILPFHLSHFVIWGFKAEWRFSKIWKIWKHIDTCPLNLGPSHSSEILIFKVPNSLLTIFNFPWSTQLLKPQIMDLFLIHCIAFLYMYVYISTHTIVTKVNTRHNKSCKEVIL